MVHTAMRHVSAGHYFHILCHHAYQDLRSVIFYFLFFIIFIFGKEQLLHNLYATRIQAKTTKLLGYALANPSLPQKIFHIRVARERR